MLAKEKEGISLAELKLELGLRAVVIRILLDYQEDPSAIREGSVLHSRMSQLAEVKRKLEKLACDHIDMYGS